MQPMDGIYQKYAQMVYKYLMSLCHDDDTAQELTQETFYQAIRSSGKYDESCRISTWLCAIAKNVFLTWKRKNPQHASLSELSESGEKTQADEYDTLDKNVSGPSAESLAISSVQRVDIFRTVHMLPDPYKEVLYLRIFGDLSFREIGDIHSKTENWARVTFYRGKEKLRKMMEDESADIQKGSERK